MSTSNPGYNCIYESNVSLHPSRELGGIIQTLGVISKTCSLLLESITNQPEYEQFVNPSVTASADGLMSHLYAYGTRGVSLLITETS